MTDNQQPADTGETPPQPGLRFLEMTVYIMGGLLVIMLLVLLGGIAWKVTRGKAPEGPPKASLIDIAAPAGATIAGALNIEPVSSGARTPRSVNVSLPLMPDIASDLPTVAVAPRNW